MIQLHNHKKSTQHDHKYFVQDQITRGKEILLQANIKGDINTKYGLAIAMLYESNDEEIQLLFLILNQPDGKKNSPKLLTNPSTYTFRNKHISYPKKPSLQKNWSGSLGL